MIRSTYMDGRGVEKVGTIESIVNSGGSDIRYFMRDDAGKLDVVPGSRMGHNVPDAQVTNCANCGQPLSPDETLNCGVCRGERFPEPYRPGR